MALLLVSPLTLAQPCGTQDSCKVDVEFKGNYLEKTCELSINNGTENETVSLPVISTNTLDHDGAEAGSQLFAITLKDCPTNKAISLYFASTSVGVDTLTSNLLNTTGSEYSQNVEVRLRNSGQQQMIINDPASSQSYDVSVVGDVTHQFIASYYAAGSSKVSAGLLNTSAAIVVNYK
ncbi:fimbrial protein [Enterobacteriaceae bacterium RIT714]|nr:fimbrial protein [Enterobacteriaceae bacterium RIT714]